MAPKLDLSSLKPSTDPFAVPEAADEPEEVLTETVEDGPAILVTCHLPAELWNITGAANVQFTVTSPDQIQGTIEAWKTNIVDVLREEFADQIQQQPASQSGNRSSRGGGPRRSAGGGSPASEKQMALIEKLVGERDMTMDDVFNELGTDMPTAQQASGVIEKLMTIQPVKKQRSFGGNRSGSRRGSW